MENGCPKRPSHKEWRRQVKKERRKRLRRKTARERDEEAARLEKILLQTCDYVLQLQEQNKLKEEEEKRAQEQHALLEKAWIEAEEKAQKEWQILQERKAKAREVQLAQEEIIRKEFEIMQDNARKKKEAERRRRDDQKKMYERMKKEIDAYVDDGARTPKALRSINETQPGKEICPFFNKTGACRYGDICSRNHQRPGLSTVILVPNFYTHFSLERHSHNEYDTDVRLEYDHRETRNHFRDFYFDVVPELEKFGKIKTLQYCKNTEAHLRGNLYVEYATEREAARALRGLKGRWYAGRQLHCEFVNLKSWRGAICGMIRCPKGSACNFLHTFRNPTEDYGVKSPPLWQKRQELFDNKNSSRRSNFSNRRSNWNEEYDNGQDRSRNWRWSESPEGDDRRQGGRQNQYRPQMQRNFHQRNQFNNRNNNFDNRRNNDNRNFYNNRRPRNFNDNRTRYSDDDRDDNRYNRPQRRQFNYNDRFKRKYSDSDDNEDYGSGKMRKRERRSLDKRSRSRSRSRSASRSVSRSRSRSGSRSRSRSHSGSRSRSVSKSGSRSRTRSRSPLNLPPAEEHDFHASRMRSKELGRPVGRSESHERKRRPPSPPKEKSHLKAPRKPPSHNVTKWDNEKREDSSTESRDSRSRSRSRSRSASPYKVKEYKNNVSAQQSAQHRDIQQHSYSKPPPPSASAGNSNRGGGQKVYEWDTTDSEN